MAVITDKYGLYSLFNYVILLLDICRIGEKLRYCRKFQYLSVLEFSWKNIMPCFTQYSQCDRYRYDFMKIFVFLNFTTLYTYLLIKNIIFKLLNLKKKITNSIFGQNIRSPQRCKKSYLGDNKDIPV